MIKVAVFSLGGKKIALEEKRSSIVYSEDGFVEKDMEELWKALSSLIKETLYKHDISVTEIKGIGLSAYGDGVITLDKDKNIIGLGITSIDTRSKHTWGSLLSKSQHQELFKIIRQKPFLGTPLPILHWIYTHDKQRWEKTEFVIFAKDYIRYKLTGEIFLEITDASAGLINLNTRTRDLSIEETLSINHLTEKIPDVVTSDQVVGEVNKEAETDTGFKEGTPVVAGLHDVASTVIGSGCINHSDTLIILGTWGITVMSSNSPQDHAEGDWMLRCLPKNNRWLMLQASPSAGSNIDWFVKTLKQINTDNNNIHKVLNTLIKDTLPGAKGLRYLPYLHGQKFSNQTLNALFYGITFEHELKHFYRAILEGILVDRIKVLAQFEKSIDSSPSMLTIQGGGSKNNTWMQMFADATNKTIRVLQSSQAGVRGAAILAGVGVGLFNSIGEGVEIIKDKEIFYNPNIQNFEEYKEIQESYQELINSLV